MHPAFVVLTDFSPAAERALRYTTRLAEQVDGRLVLLHVYQDPLLEPEAAMVTLPMVLQSRKQILAELAERARQQALPTETHLSIDTLGDAVTEVVAQHHPLLLALGREQHSTMIDRLLRHQAGPILQTARYPLLLVPECWSADAAPRRLVVAADDHGFWLTPQSLALGELIARWQPSTTVVHVGPAHGPSQAAVGFEAVRRCELFGPLSDNSLYEVREEATATGILHAAAELQADMLVVLARPHTFLDGLFHRSVTAQLLQHSPVPVLVLPTMH
ncbi:universal stress protein [Hymenobacter jeollabukensis]|uniref:Universal stress protein n=1 Tax=Hymenobacter jeollabukensis TaxID=2025313 RepID=A0A5R8WY66_9BACT|nr:universal stress protein [Hymenobacter jeollabukensis]TLM96983.1 universal stress protein [Hymenobacter jeollabukensis]